MNLRKSGNDLVDHSEALSKLEPPRRRKITLGKLIYFAIIIALVLFALYYLINRIFFVKGMGVFTAHETNIATVEPARIEQINVVRNQEIQRGDTLVVVDYEDAAYGGGYTTVQRTPSASQRDESKILDAQKDLQLLRLEKNRYDEELLNVQKELDKARELYRKELLTTSELKKYKEKVEEAQFKLQKINKSIQYERLLIKNLQTTGSEKTVVQHTGGGGSHGDRYLIANHDGIVSTVKKTQYETVNETETILTLANTNDRFVVTYFAFRYRRYVRPGTYVKVMFNDGYSYRGIIRQIFRESDYLLEEFRKEFSLREKFIVAKVFIIPKTKLKPEDFNSVAQQRKVTVSVVFNELVQTGYINKKGELIAPPDENLVLLNAANRPYVNQIRGTFLNLLRELDKHILGCSVSINYAKLMAADREGYSLHLETVLMENLKPYQGKEIKPVPPAPQKAAEKPITKVKPEPAKETKQPEPKKPEPKQPTVKEKPKQAPADKKVEEKSTDKPAQPPKKEEEKKNNAETTRTYKQIYDDALNQLWTGDPLKAERLFQELLTMDPKHYLAPNVNYWLGEIKFTREDFAQSAEFFSNVIAKYPDSHKVSDARLRLAMTYIKLDRKKQAIEELETLSKQSNYEKMNTVNELLSNLKGKS